ncbi:hypothetical protein JCM6882_003784 [Rhodosporidiobolus microsporus]
MSSTDCTDCAPEPSTSSSTVTQPVAPPVQDAALDPSTFAPPVLNQRESGEELPRVVLEFCDRCRWLHRATWTQTELFLTFPPPLPPAADSAAPAPGLKAITLLPRNAPETGGRFRVWLLREGYEGRVEQQRKEGKGKWAGWDLVWDRKVEGRFPEMKELKQRIRNLIAPSLSLGHSDKPSTHAAASSSSTSSSSGPQTAPSIPPLPASVSDAQPLPTEVRTAQQEEEEMPPFPGAEEASTAGGRKPGQLLASDFAPSFRCG